MKGLLRDAAAFNSIKLMTTIITTRKYFHEELSHFLIFWLRDLPTKYPFYAVIYRKIICTVFLSPLTRETLYLDFFLNTDPGLWKIVRREIRQLYLNTFMMAEENLKIEFGTIFLTQVHGLLINIYR